MTIDFEKMDGLVPAIIQDAKTLKVLMLGFMNEEAYQKIKEDATHREYFSISYITRTYFMGYSRAGKMFKRLQNEGIVAQSGDARGCKVLVYTPGGQQGGTIEQSTFVPDDGDNYE